MYWTVDGLAEILSGGDRRSIGRSNELAEFVVTQEDFDVLFGCMAHADRLVAMRAADAIEKLTVARPELLQTHKIELLKMCENAFYKEMKWHLALLLPRLRLQTEEWRKAWSLLMAWAKEKRNSKLVRVNALQALYEMVYQDPGSMAPFYSMMVKLQEEGIPSLDARIRKIMAELKS